MSADDRVIHHNGYTEYIISEKSEDYSINLVYVLPVMAVVLVLIWWRVRGKKRS